MLFALALFGSVFPATPLADQVAIGRKLAVTERNIKLADLFRSPEPRSSISRIWGADRKTIGTWSNGYVKVPVEHVLWLSPSLLSRWLGFLSAREYWDEDEVDSRWSSIADEMGDRHVFIVQLTAFPKLPTYGIGDVERTEPEEIENVRFVYTSGKSSSPMQAVKIAQWQSRDRFALEGFAWWKHTGLDRYISGEFDVEPTDAPLPLGDYHRAWYLVWVEDTGDQKFEVRVLSRRKERVARFSQPAKKSP